jgi:ABC-type enterochelin transport system permease subunit
VRQGGGTRARGDREYEQVKAWIVMDVSAHVPVAVDLISPLHFMGVHICTLAGSI